MVQFIKCFKFDFSRTDFLFYFLIIIFYGKRVYYHEKFVRIDGWWLVTLACDNYGMDLDKIWYTNDV